MPTRAMAVAFGPISWAAVIGGVFIALIVHILLNMLGAGVGAASVDLREQSDQAVATLSWGAFAWWSISGIIAAFFGGWAAGGFASTSATAEGGVHGFLSWAVTSVLIVTFGALAAGGAAAAVISPLTTATAQLQGATDEAQTAFATFSLASFVALVIGAAAAVLGGRWAAQYSGAPASSRRAHA